MFTNNSIDIEELPHVENVPLEPIDSKYLYILILNIASLFGLMFCALFVVRWFSEDEGFRMISFYMLIVIGVVGVIILILYILGFKNRKYGIRENDMTYTHGYLTTKQITLPYNRIQHIEIKRSFLARKMGLSTLKMYSAGESGGDLAIRGLPVELANRLYQHLTQIINERV